MSVLERYQAILKMSDKSLMRLVNQYNAGGLSPKTRLALEVIDGCVGPGDAIHISQ